MESQYCAALDLDVRQKGEIYLVDHHDSEEIADGGEEDAVKVVLDFAADSVGDGI